MRRQGSSCQGPSWSIIRRDNQYFRIQNSMALCNMCRNKSLGSYLNHTSTDAQRSGLAYAANPPKAGGKAITKQQARGGRTGGQAENPLPRKRANHTLPGHPLSCFSRPPFYYFRPQGHSPTGKPRAVSEARALPITQSVEPSPPIGRPSGHAVHGGPGHAGLGPMAFPCMSVWRIGGHAWGPDPYTPPAWP
jgi:hypothetical protein